MRKQPVLLLSFGSGNTTDSNNLCHIDVPIQDYIVIDWLTERSLNICRVSCD